MTLLRKALHGVVAAGAAALLVSGMAAAQDQKALERAIEARKGVMNIHSWEAGPLFAMAKGDVPYDAATATDHAQALNGLLNYDETRLFAAGSSNAEMPDKTRALPAIWERPDDFHRAFENLRSAVSGLVGSAGDGHEALVAAMGPVGNACGDCHESFRQKN